MPNPSRKSGRSRRPLRPPPNYFARRTQLRLLALVALLMLVIIAIPMAADPDNYAWMGFKNGAGGGESANGESANGESANVDTRLPPDGLRPRATPPEDSVVAVENLTSDEPHEPLYLARKDAWHDLLGELTREQRDLLNRVLRRLRREEPLSASDKAEWLLQINRFEEGWRKYLEQARASLESLPESQREVWSRQLDKLEREWNDDLHPALAVALEDRPLQPAERWRLEEFQQLLDRLALDQVQDDAPYQAVERDAWFRMLELLKMSPLEQLERESIGDVGYLQLFRQSKEYRGKLATIRGRVRQAYRVPAPQNDFDIDSYQVFWLRTEGGPNSPIVVYALDAPEGFPELGPQAYAEDNRLDEPVEITGFFFKRWAYPAQDGPRSAPLMLAKVPRWSGPAETAEDGLSPLVLVTFCVIGAVIIAVLVTTLVYLFGGGARTGFRMPSLYAARPADLKALEQVETLPNVEQSLEALQHHEERPPRTTATDSPEETAHSA